MSRKTRKLIWSAPLVAVLAVAGALAIFAAMAQGSVQAAHEMLPGAPQNLSIMADGHHAIKLSWDAPTSGGTPTGYRIDRSEDNGTWFTHEPMHTGTSYTDSGLDAGSTYFYRVFAYNTAGTGPVSEDRTETTEAATAPGRVRNLTAMSTGQNSIMLTWQAPEKNGGAPIKHYEIHFAPEPDGSAVAVFPPAATLAGADDDDTVIATDGPVLTHNHGMLTAETRYRYIVYAVNDEDHKGMVPSALKAAVTDKLTAPGRPDRLTAVHSDDTVVQLYWYAPADTGGTAITGYDTEVRTNCTGDWENVDTQWTNVATSPHDASWNLDGTDRETSACFRVRAHNSPSTVTEDDERRYGPWSGTTTLQLLATDAARVLAVPPAVTDGEASYTTDRAKVTWTAADLEDRTADRISSYRVDVSEDGISWMRIPRCFSTNRADDNGDPFCEYAYEGGEPRTYRVLAQIAGRFGPSIDPFASTADDATVTAPGHVRNLAVTASGPTQIDLTWNAPTSDGGAPIDHYIVQASMMGEADFDAWPTDLGTDTTGNFKSETTSYPHMKLKAGQTWRYRVFAVNKDADGDFLPDTASLPANAGEAEVDQATTTQEDMPGKPEQLSIEMASTSNSVAAGSAGLLLLWNAPLNPAGADIAGYQVQRKKNDSQWATLSDTPHTGNTFTDFTDTEGLAGNELRAYRVRAISENGVEGAWSETTYYPHDLLVPGKPTLSAMKDADMPGTKVKLTWTAPAMNADLVTGYIIERRYAGDMMGDIPSDGYNAGVMGASHAFMDYKEWWETLNCKGMLAVAGSSASDTATQGESAQDTADRDMYCKHFANTAPTNMAFAGKTVDEATAMKIKEMFMKRYVTDDMGKTMTMFTGMMYTDMGLMENTEYTYRVRAIHGMKAGMWSDKAMVTTGSDNNDPRKVDTIPAVTVEVGETSDPMDVSMYFRDADMDDLTYRAMSDDEMIATANIPSGSSMLTITGVAEDTATVTVYASDGKGGTDAMQTIAVTVTPGTLTSPSNVRATQSGNMVTIEWDGGMNADTFTVAMLARKADGSWDIPNAVYDQNLSGSPHTVHMSTRPAGTYIVGVAAGTDDGMWSDWVMGSVDYQQP